MAADVGAKLLQDVEDIRLDEILQDVRHQEDSTIHPFDFPPLDRLVEAASEIWPKNTRLATRPIVELLSLAAGSGKTQLLYKMCAMAVLPAHLGGRQAVVVVVDPDETFIVDRLAVIMQSLLSGTSDHVDEDVISALRHVHILRPQSIASVSATLETLPDYLMDNKRHHSYDRRVAFIAIDTISAFYWQDRSRSENAAFLVSTGEVSANLQDQSEYKQFFTSLKEATNILCCPAIVATWHLSAPQFESKDPRAHRSQIPDFRPDLRLVIRRSPVRRYPPGVDVDQALRETANRQAVVDQHRFECFVNHLGLAETHLRAFNGRGGGFCYFVGHSGVSVDEEHMEEAGEEESPDSRVAQA